MAIFKNSFSFFLALRYLKPKRSFLFVITIISVLGVTLGIALLILVMSIMSGFGLELQRKVIGFEAHLVVTDNQKVLIDDWREIIEEAETVEGIETGAPFIMGPVLVEFNNRIMAPKIRAIDIEMESQVSQISQFIRYGSTELSGDHALLGIDLARHLGVTVGDQITVFSARNVQALVSEVDRISQPDATEADREGFKEMILPTTLEVTGIFQSGRYAYDSEILIVPLHIGQEMYLLGDAVHGISFRTKDPYRAGIYGETLATKLSDPPGRVVSTWMDLNQELFNAIQTERSMMFFLLLCISVVAGFCIMNTLITVTVLKTREIGILKALGATNSQVVWVFLFQGVVVGLVGTLSGMVIGLAVVHWRNQIRQMLSSIFRVDVFPQSIYEFTEIPAHIVPGDILLICCSAFLISSLAALIPAYFAARLDPVKALRYE